MEDFGVNVSKLVKIESACETPGMKIRSKGKGRGLARGGGRGPMGRPYYEDKEGAKKKNIWSSKYEDLTDKEKKTKKKIEEKRTKKSIENDINKIIGDFNEIGELINKKSKTYYATVAGEKALKLIRRGVKGAKKIKGKVKQHLAGLTSKQKAVYTAGAAGGGAVGAGGYAYSRRRRK